MAVIEKIRATALRLLKIDRRLDDIKINQGRILSELLAAKRGAPLHNYEFKVFSQWGEDGILQFLTKNLAVANRTFIEFGVEDFFESNCRFLMMKDHWRGFVIDGSPRNIERLRSAYFYWQSSLNSKSAFITRENVGGLLSESGFHKELGILSVDIDGVDYHVLERLDEWRPSIVIVEYNALFGRDRAVTVPYKADFYRTSAHPSNLYYGASLSAFAHLLTQRGYALVGVNGVGSNAFFVRHELLNDVVVATDVESCFRAASFREGRGQDGRLTFHSRDEGRAAIGNLPLVDVVSGAELKVRDLSG